jgi:predicted FMN-binding regulatory protein PaiB
MFQSPLFCEERIDIMHSLMKKHPFATLVPCNNGQLSAELMCPICEEPFPTTEVTSANAHSS